MNPLRDALAARPRERARVAVAYSGGTDSTALLHVVAGLFGADHIRALHVCHHLQPAADAWAVQCAAQCNAWGVEFLRLDVAVDFRHQGMEAGARRARYAALAGALAQDELLAVAHHAEDQAETFLSQALRGAGVHGLAGMPVMAGLGAGWLWRPWLAISRDRIVDYLHANQLHWIDDPSNHDRTIMRGYLRTELWPALIGRWPAAATTLSRSARWAAEAAEAVDTLAAIDLERALGSDTTLRLAPLRELTAARVARLLRRWLAEQGSDTPDHRHIDQMLRLLHARQTANACVEFAETAVRCFDGCLFVMRRLGPPPDARLAWDGEEPLALPAEAGQLLVDRPGTSGGIRQRVCFTVCFRQGGERLSDGSGRDTALKNWFQGRRVPPWQRERVPLVYAGDTLVAVAGMWSNPTAEAWPDGVPRVFVWRHSLPDAPLRVVGAKPLG